MALARELVRGAVSAFDMLGVGWGAANCAKGKQCSTGWGAPLRSYCPTLHPNDRTKAQANAVACRPPGPWGCYRRRGLQLVDQCCPFSLVQTNIREQFAI